MNTHIAIIDVGAGNLYSVEKAVRHVMPASANLTICDNPEALKNATHIVLPGVGAFADCMQGLLSREGLREALEQKVLVEKLPFFGICVGMQMLFERGYEHGEHDGLGWLKGEVVSLKATLYSPLVGESKSASRDWVGGEEKDSGFGIRGSGDTPPPNLPPQGGEGQPTLKIPHMGWNELRVKQSHPYLEGLTQDDHAYFVHSYHCQPREDVAVLTVDYGGEVVAAVARDNIFATQFHPEKSQKTGLRILQNFLQMPHASKD